MAFADVFLPASMSCERNTQRVWWVPLRGMKKVTQFADVRSDDTIVTDLGRRLHPENFPWTDDIGWTNDILVNDTPGYDGDFERLCKDVYVYPAFEYRKHEKGLLRPDGQPGFNTPSGRIELYNSIFALWGYDPLPQWDEPSWLAVRLAGAVRAVPLRADDGRALGGVLPFRASPSWRRAASSTPIRCSR